MEIEQLDEFNGIKRVCRLPAATSRPGLVQLGGRKLLWIGIVFIMLGWFMLLFMPLGVVLVLFSQKPNLRSGTSFVRSHKSKIVLIFVILGFLAWSPWMTNDYAIDLVTDRLGGPEEPYDYLGSTIPVVDVPKNVVRVPFGALVYFPGEAMFIVTFWGGVL